MRLYGLALAAGLVVSASEINRHERQPLVEPVVISRCGAEDPGDNGFVLAVLGEGFPQDQRGLLKHRVDEVLCRALETDPVLASIAKHITIKTIAVDSDTDEIARTGHEARTALKLGYNGLRAACFFSPSDATKDLVPFYAARAIRSYSFAIVMANLPDQNTGCTIGSFSYMSSGIDWATAAHELGHLLYLSDEYADQEGDGHMPATLATANCAADANPWWLNQVAGSSQVRGCNHYGNLTRGFDSCRMNKPGDDFCSVCKHLLQGLFVAPPQLGSALHFTQLAIELVANQDGSLKTAKVIRTSDVVGAPINARVRWSEATALLLSDGKAVTGGLASGGVFNNANRLVSRAYGGSSNVPHTTAPALSSVVSVQVPALSGEALKSSDVEFRVVRSAGKPTDGPAPEILNDLAKLPSILKVQHLQIR